MKHLLLLFSIYSSIITVSMGQVHGLDDESKFKERIYFGGGFDLAFDQNRSIIGLSPNIGYMITKTTSFGVGVTYQLLYFRANQLTTDIYGYRAFLRQNLIAQLFLYAEYENLSYKDDFFVDNSGRFWEDSYYVGGGWFKPINRQLGFLMLGLYNLKKRNYAGSPWSFRAGFTYSPFSFNRN